MSRSEVEHLSQDGQAFEYATGVLRGKERERFETALQQNPDLREQVQFWEEQLMQLSDAESTHKPHPKTWEGIETRIKQSLSSREKPSKNWLLWLAPGVLTVLLISCLLLLLPMKKIAEPNADYAAVLTNSKGDPILTALTATSNNIVWLKWEKITIPQDKNLQLWAQSKRDGQIRPITVFAQTGARQLALSKANLHLIKEAAALILTEEDVGGSALDEPSDTVLAKGACVLLTPSTI